YGPLDLLGAVGQDLGFNDLLPHSAEIQLIVIKEELAGEKDLAMLPLLRQTLNEIRKKQQS
ncbi:MAG: hypothetical protein WBW33_23420, partial [Bryobacteraceae bacterium]